MKKGKIRLAINVIFFVFIILVIIYNEQITSFIVTKYIYNKNDAIILTKNKYSLENNYESVQITDDFVAQDYQHLTNIVYTIIDSGNEEAFFYCDKKYKNCLKDLDKLIPTDSTSQYDILSDINNLVHPYNTYKKLTVVTNNYGKVIIKITKQYTNKQIDYINNEIDKINLKILKNGMNDGKKILAFHDYIVNTTKYDKDRAKNLNNKTFKNSESHTAYGLLKNHLALCGGYSDIMSIYLSKMNVKNIRISSDTHVWNLVYFNKKWSHLDATWDDPVTETGAQILVRDYFFINTTTLFQLDRKEHNFNKDFYKEAN